VAGQGDDARLTVASLDLDTGMIGDVSPGQQRIPCLGGG
jgi:hypothetical protein